MPVNDRADIDWAPRVSLSKIRLLYVREAQGICSDALIEEVGYGLYTRCESILEFSEAVENGRVKCKRCARFGTATFIERVTRSSATPTLLFFRKLVDSTPGGINLAAWAVPAPFPPLSTKAPLT